MMPVPPGHYVLDTCCLVKLFVDEPGEATGRVRGLLGRLPDGIKLWVSPFSLVEALGVFKRRRQVVPGSETYVRCVALLDAYARSSVFHVVDVRLSQEALLDSLDAARGGEIDVLDALHFHLMMSSPFKGEDVPSIAILTTTDGALGQLARDRGFFVWNPGKTAQPELS